MTPQEMLLVSEHHQHEMAVVADSFVVGTLARCISCETPTHDATTCAVCIEFGDPCLYCGNCVRACVECKEAVCFEHMTKQSDRCRECTRRDDKMTGDQA